MKLVDGIKATGTQRFSISASDGSNIDFTLYYRPAVQIWIVDIVNGDFTLNGQKLCTHLNMLQQYEKNIPFGLALITSDGGEPFLINDFSSGRCQLYVLTADEVLEVSQYYKDLKNA